MRLIPIVLALALMGASCKVKEDSSELSAVRGNDLTILMSTDGDGNRKGLAHVYLVENGGPKKITVFVPGVSCPEDSCVSLHGVQQDGSLLPIDSVAKDQNKVEFDSDVLTGDVTLDDSGPYRLLMKITQTIDGEEYLRLGRGVVYVTVLAKGYARLVCNSSDVAYIGEISSECSAQYTTKLRSALCGGCE